MSSAGPIKVEVRLLPERVGVRGPALFLDLDGTLRTSAETYALPGRQAVIPAALYRAWQYRGENYWVIGVTNQGAVAKGERTWKQVEDALREIQVLAGGLFDAVYVCPHSSAAQGTACTCHKPFPGMGLRAMADFPIETSHSLVVGNSEADEGFAENLGLIFQPAEEFTAEVQAEEPGSFRRDRAEGALFGLACGDSLGANLESLTPEKIKKNFGRVSDFVPGRWEQGAPTDDIDLALIWLRHFADGGDGYGFSAREDLARRLRAWLDHGPQGVGNQTAAALRASRRKPAVLAALEVWEESGRRAAGNGALMRCAPVAVRHWNSPASRLAASLACSALTHADPSSLWACVALNEAVAGFIRGEDDPEPKALAMVSAAAPDVARVFSAAENFDVSAADLYSDMGFVLLGLQVAFAELRQGKSFEESLLEVINRGGDADTNAAVTGALLGAKFGKNAIPERWLSSLLVKDEIAQLLDRLSPKPARSARGK